MSSPSLTRKGNAMSIRVRALEVCYHNHKRWKPGEIFEIKNMEAFSKKSMVKVEKDAVDKTPDEHETSQSALSEGTKKALHDGEVVDPKKAGEETDKLNEKKEDGPDGGEQTPAKEKEETTVEKDKETTGDEDVI